MIEVLSTVLSALGDGFVGFFQRTPWDVIHDCLDIGLVAVLIYWALVILRGTRAMQVAIGLCLVFVGYLFVRRAASSSSSSSRTSGARWREWEGAHCFAGSAPPKRRRRSKK
ncbi:MAG: hypothetical protein JRJ10_01595 [Deltaproteobacteria bacterium]|nr:hypothetical protein [Deltaproteobacteria bacterium]